MGYSPWGHKESDVTVWLSIHAPTHTHICIFMYIFIYSSVCVHKFPSILPEQPFPPQSLKSPLTSVIPFLLTKRTSMHKTIPFLPCRWLLAVFLCDGEVRTLPSGAEGQGRAPSWGPHMAGRAPCRWTNGVQRPEGWSGRTTRTPIGDVETGPRVGRWTREEGQRGTGQAGSEEDPMHTQSNTHTWEHSTKGHMFTSVQLFSVAQSCLTLCDPMDCSTPGLPVHHQLPELAQTHVHWVGDAIQSYHPLSSPSLPAFNLSQHQGLF